MEKILDSEFRKVLYKNLTDAGYSKEEAQKIVGRKYYDTLYAAVSQTVTDLLASITEERFDDALAPDFNNKVAELKKLKEILG
jgi:transposase